MFPAAFIRFFTRNLSLAIIAIAGIAVPRAEILDQAEVHNAYNNGDFDQVEADIAAFRSRNKTYGRDDSIFIAKHLAVVYAANPGTREKGRYYMFQLLELMPAAKLVDMFVSEEIDRIFEKVREEYNSKSLAKSKTPNHAYSSGETGAVPDPAPEPGTHAGKGPPKAGGSNLSKYWVAGGVGLIAIGATAYFLISQDEAPEDKVYVVDKKN